MEIGCVCGERLKGKSDDQGKYIEGSVAKEYREHMNRDDHKSSPAQWTEAQKRIEEAKERAKSKQ